MCLTSLLVLPHSKSRSLFPFLARSWTPIVDYVNEQFELYLAEEVSIQRKRYIPDTRIHCCLYFIQPTGHA